jgi:hypothetical protein
MLLSPWACCVLIGSPTEAIMAPRLILAYRVGEFLELRPSLVKYRVKQNNRSFIFEVSINSKN